MLHTIVRTIRQLYPGVVFGGYLLAFFVAFALVFMLPIGALGMVFLAAMALIPVVFLLGIVRAIERPLALKKLRANRCPACDARAIEPPSADHSELYRCKSCGVHFSLRGEDAELPDSTDSSDSSDSLSAS